MIETQVVAHLASNVYAIGRGCPFANRSDRGKAVMVYEDSEDLWLSLIAVSGSCAPFAHVNVNIAPRELIILI